MRVVVVSTPDWVLRTGLSRVPCAVCEGGEPGLVPGVRVGLFDVGDRINVGSVDAEGGGGGTFCTIVSVCKNRTSIGE